MTLLAPQITERTTATGNPFTEFVAKLRPQDPLRAAITAAYRRSEPECVSSLLAAATLAGAAQTNAEKLARRLVSALREKMRPSGVQGLIHEYSLSSQEGVALMCLAEALLRIPDSATRDALIRDKISGGDWRSHLGRSPSLFVNAATWGLLVTGKLTNASNADGLGAALTRLVARGGEPLIRRAVDLAMRYMGETFVTGQTIDEALHRSKAMELRGFRYSFDMLGEAAMSAEDAARYFKDYENAIHAIGRASNQRGVYDGPGISIKLSALHPRYSRAQIERVRAELLPRVNSLAVLAKSYDIGLNIDAEEADRLELSLDILEALALDTNLSDWQGLGFVVQAYGKRCPFVIDWIIDLARRAQRRIMVRLVKGAYWDAEIKRAQVDGLADFPVFTRKVHTDVSYLACARRLLDAPDAVFPQFATHNAQTLAAVFEMAGPDFKTGQYEFQCLHGMGEPLYDEVVGAESLGRPCRIYAPVGTHETLLAYLVRRLLENGANSSFVNRIAEEQVSIDDLVADPVKQVLATSKPGAPHEKIANPRSLYGASRTNSAGLDLSNEQSLASLGQSLAESAALKWKAYPTLGDGHPPQPITNPSNHNDKIGKVCTARPQDVETAIAAAVAGQVGWSAVPVETRAAILRRAADTLEGKMPVLIGLIVREAGKTYGNAVAEVREAVDFLRYYAVEAERTLCSGDSVALGPVVGISPWNFPLAIFAGQIAAALAAGNTVLAKPAEETPLIAAEMVRILHSAGVPQNALLLIPGDGSAGAALVADARVMGVAFTGSTQVARHIQRQLSRRILPDGQPVPLIAETGGINVLIADSSALVEQVVADTIASAFDSAGQRCSALRILCLQSETADRTLAMLNGALKELQIGDPVDLATDVGPVITAQAQADIEAYITAMQARGHRVSRAKLNTGLQQGTFVAPAIIEINRITDVAREVFGPVLHVLRFERRQLDQLITEINDTGYGLTFGLHTRIDETIQHIGTRISAGNVYINRNIIGATVGVQPFGGSSLSGTGPKAGGPLYLGRFLRRRPAVVLPTPSAPEMPAGPAREFADWLRANGHRSEAEAIAGYISRSPLGWSIETQGPVGESNVYALKARGKVGIVAQSPSALHVLTGAALAAGNQAVIELTPDTAQWISLLPASLRTNIFSCPDIAKAPDLNAVLTDVTSTQLARLVEKISAREGSIVSVFLAQTSTSLPGADVDLTNLVEEVTTSTNTAAAGGNASLMAIG